MRAEDLRRVVDIADVNGLEPAAVCKEAYDRGAVIWIWLEGVPLARSDSVPPKARAPSFSPPYFTGAASIPADDPGNRPSLDLAYRGEGRDPMTMTVFANLCWQRIDKERATEVPTEAIAEVAPSSCSLSRLLGRDDRASRESKKGFTIPMSRMELCDDAVTIAKRGKGWIHRLGRVEASDSSDSPWSESDEGDRDPCHEHAVVDEFQGDRDIYQVYVGELLLHVGALRRLDLLDPDPMPSDELAVSAPEVHSALEPPVVTEAPRPPSQPSTSSEVFNESLALPPDVTLQALAEMLDAGHPRYAPELGTAVRAWIACHRDGRPSTNAKVQRFAKDRRHDGAQAERIATVVNPGSRKKGGAPKTPG
jgi:hypothetical protein